MITMLVTTVLVTGAALSGAPGEGIPRPQLSKCAQVRWLRGFDTPAGLRSLNPFRWLHDPSPQKADTAAALWRDDLIPRGPDSILHNILATIPATPPDSIAIDWKAMTPARWPEVTSTLLRDLASSSIIITVCENLPTPNASHPTEPTPASTPDQPG
ncbi:hypothetical protein, partial [Sphaerisporangium corydalis]